MKPLPREKAFLGTGCRAVSRFVVTVCALLVIMVSSPGGAAATAELERIPVAPVWSGHPVHFAIDTSDGRQYVAFYDPERRMTVAQRSLGSTRWTFKRLPSVVGWDSHNYIVMAVDEAGFVHVSGNMHSERLVYFRSTAPHDISAFEQPGMVGSREKRVTYPRFLRDAEGRLLFQYREGKSGDGAQIVNAYDESFRTWKRLIASSLFDGGGKMSAYLAGPARGPDGYFHLLWMWRDTPKGDTNHDLSYARSRDLSVWETAAGVALPLPIRPNARAALVDPVGSGQGLAGIAFGVGWDSQQRPVITYSKYDGAGRSQSYNARFDSEWRIHQVSDWEYRWDLARTGTLGEDIVVRPLALDSDRRLIQEFRHREHGQGVWILDEESLRPTAVEPLDDRLLELKIPESEIPEMEVRDFIHDRSGDYFLRWETLPINRDRARKPPYPEPTVLEVVHDRLRSGEQVAPDRDPNEPHGRGTEDWVKVGPDTALLEANGARIGTISIHVGDIFDEEDPTENRKVFRWVNRLRRKTGDGVIRKELLFETGDTYSHRLVEESERLLRNKSFLYDADIQPVTYRDEDGDGRGEVDIEVNTRDVWTLGGGVGFSRSGGENTTRFEVDDSNFLGTGTELQVSRESDVDRTVTEVRYRNPNLMAKRGEIEIALQDNSDGYFRLLRLGQPFYALDSRRSRGLTVITERKVDPLFDRGAVTSEFGHDTDLFNLQWGFSRGLRGGSTKRWLFGFTYLEDRFSRLIDRAPLEELPADRTLSYPWVALEWVQDRFVTARNLNRIALTEDINLGSSVTTNFGIASPTFGADRSQALVGFNVSAGFQPRGGPHLVFVKGTGGTRWSGDEFENAALSGSVRLFRRNRAGRVFYAEVQAGAVENLDAEDQLLIGGDSGLRGYPLRFQSGDRRFLVTLEQRFYWDREVFKLATLGAAAFFDAGRAWFAGGNGAEDLGLLKDIGIGLRLNPTRSGRSSVIHIDVAFPLDGGGGIDSVQFLVAAKESL